MVKRSINWSPQEQQKLFSLVKKNNKENWKLIAEQIGTKTASQCQERWEKHLSQEEEQIKLILQKHKEMGTKWSQITKFLKNRTDQEAKNIFYNTLRKGIRKVGKISRKVKNSTAIVKQMTSYKLCKLLSDEAKIREYGFEKDSIYNDLFECSKKQYSQVHRARLSQPQTKRQYAALFQMFKRQCYTPKQETQNKSQQRNRRVLRIGSKKKNKGTTSQNRSDSVNNPNTTPTTPTPRTPTNVTRTQFTTQTTINNQTQPVVNQLQEDINRIPTRPQQQQYGVHQFHSEEYQNIEGIQNLTKIYQFIQPNYIGSFRNASNTNSIFGECGDRSASQKIFRFLGLSGCQSSKVNQCLQVRAKEEIQLEQYSDRFRQLSQPRQQ